MEYNYYFFLLNFWGDCHSLFSYTTFSSGTISWTIGYFLSAPLSTLLTRVFTSLASTTTYCICEICIWSTTVGNYFLIKNTHKSVSTFFFENWCTFKKKVCTYVLFLFYYFFFKYSPEFLASLTVVEIKTENTKDTNVMLWIMLKKWSKTDFFFDLQFQTNVRMNICWILGHRIQFYWNVLLSVNQY